MRVTLYKLKLGLVLLAGLLPFISKAQEGREQILQRDTTVADTVYLINYYTNQAFGQYNQELTDTLVHYYSLLRMPERTRLHTGQLGGALNNLYTYETSDLGFDSGQDQFNPYFYTEDNYYLFRMNRGLADAHYSIAGQDNSLLELNFGRHFKDENNQFRLEYKRINQTGAYNRQKAKNTHFRTGLRSLGFKDRLSTQIIMSSNLITQQDNGGVTNPEDVKNPVGGFPGNIDVQLDNADSRYHKWSFTLLNHYNPTRLNQDSQLVKKSIQFFNQLQLNTYTHRFLDQENSDNNLVHAQFTDADSVSYFMKQRTYSVKQGLYWTPQNKALQFTAALTFNNHKIDLRGANLVRNDLLFSTQLDYSFKKLQLFTDARLNIDAASPEYTLKAGLRPLKVLNEFTFNAFLDISAYSADLIEQYVVINNILKNQYDAESVFRNSVTAQLRYKKLATLQFRNESINNLRTWDSDYNLSYSDELINILSAKLTLHDNSGWLQFMLSAEARNISNERLYRAPQLSVYGRLETEFRIFKKNMTVNAGIDCWSHSGQNDIGYYPGLGIFYLADTQLNQAWYPDATFFLETKIGSFKFYYLFENIFEQIARQSGNPTIQFPISNQPLQGFRSRLGIRWIFRN